MDVHTYGLTPAAMYLVTLLNERGDPRLARKVTHALTHQRAILNDVVASHLFTHEMSRKTFGALLTMLDASIRTAMDERAKTSDPHVWALVTNILIGELKTHKQHTVQAAHEQRDVARETPDGESVPLVKARPAHDEEPYEARVERLREKSRRYLERKGKTNTLY
jgi:hypothetical protein